MARRAVVIHGWAHACAALGAAAACHRPVMLLSARGAAAYAGAGWFAALVREVRGEFPTVEFAAMLDCGNRPDLVQAAFREGLQEVCFHGSAAVARRLAEIARHWNARLHRRRPVALDLLDEPHPEEACRRWLGVTAKTRRARLTHG